MIDILRPIWQQFGETYEAIRKSIQMFPEDKLEWSPGGSAPSAAGIVHHISQANLLYANVIGPTEYKRTPGTKPTPTVVWLMGSLENSEKAVLETLEGITPETLIVCREKDWCPLMEEQLVKGSLDALWFAQQIVRHSAYHLGQLSMYLRLLE